jgi:hypothetical protein
MDFYFTTDYSIHGEKSSVTLLSNYWTPDQYTCPGGDDGGDGGDDGGDGGDTGGNTDGGDTTDTTSKWYEKKAVIISASAGVSVVTIAILLLIW